MRPLGGRLMNRAIIDRTFQWGLVVVYACLTLAGIAATVASPPAMQEVLGDAWTRVWALFLLLGSAVCLGGVLIPRGKKGDWFGEYAGLPLVASTVALYGAVASTTVDRIPGRTATVLLLWACALMLMIRWWRVRGDAHKATRVNVADHRDLIADNRDVIADARDVLADERDARADRRDSEHHARTSSGST